MDIEKKKTQTIKQPCKCTSGPCLGSASAKLSSPIPVSCLPFLLLGVALSKPRGWGGGHHGFGLLLLNASSWGFFAHIPFLLVVLAPQCFLLACVGHPLGVLFRHGSPPSKSATSAPYLHRSFPLSFSLRVSPGCLHSPRL